MYHVKNIGESNWRDRKYMVIRDCRNEEAPNDGWWYYCTCNSLTLAQEALNEIGNGLIVETSEVEPVDIHRHLI